MNNPGTLNIRVLGLIFSSLAGGLALGGDQGLIAIVNFTGDNGGNPGTLIQAPDGTFYGTTSAGGKNDLGTLFMVPLDKPLVTLVTFDGNNGASPSPRLILTKNGYLYGTTRNGGTNGMGTVYKVTPDGKLLILVSFDHHNGETPQADLVVTENGDIYGCTDRGGIYDEGTIFRVDPDNKFETLINFSGDNGAYPQGLARGPDGRFYGATGQGGDFGHGTAYAISSQGIFTTLHSFGAADGTNERPHMILMSENNFYGTTLNGGINNMGTLYSISPQGDIYDIQDFNDRTGSHPGPDLVEWNNGFFYMKRLWDNLQFRSNAVQWIGTNYCGTTTSGGEHGQGTIFRVTRGGTLATLVSFSGTGGKNPGSSPTSLLPGNDGNLYGTTSRGGTQDKGTIFCLTMPSSRPGSSPSPPPFIARLPELTSPPVVSY